MLDRLRVWWKLDEASEAESVDNPFAPVAEKQRQNTFPMLALAFGWGFLITGLLTGGQVGAGLAFWPDLVFATLTGNAINFVVGALVAYVGFKTACNSGLIYQFVYGRIGVYLPICFLAILLTGWQAILVGAFGYTFAQSFTSTTFYVIAIAGGLLFTATAYFGVKAIERVSLPSVAVLVVVGLYAAYVNVGEAGGMASFLTLSRDGAAKAPITFAAAVNLAVGSWIVGAVVMAEYSRFAKKAWVAIAIPFIVMIVAQWFLQIVGAMGAVVSGSADFTAYLRNQGMVVAGLGIIGMSLALWTTGNANLYLPAIQTAAVFRRPKRVMVVVWGLVGTVLGLGLYQHFMSWINLLATLVPPLIGPLIIDFYVVNKRRYSPAALASLPAWNPAAIAAYLVGAVCAYAQSSGLIALPDSLIPAVFGLAVSMLVYGLLIVAAAVFRIRIGYAAAAHSEP